MSLKDIRPGFRAFLLASSGVTSLAGQRVFPLRMPQGETRASVVYQRISGEGDHHMQGASGMNRVRMQVGAWAKETDDANALADAVKFRLDGYKGPMGSGAALVQVQGVFFVNERDLYDTDSNLHGVARDYSIVFEEW